MIPSKEQWRKWSLPSKLTAMGVAVSIISIIVTIAISLYGHFKNNSAPIEITSTPVTAKPEENESFPLIIKTAPFSCDIYVDGLYEGISRGKIKINFTRGLHKIRLEKNDKSKEFDLLIPHNRKQIFLELKEKTNVD